MSFQQYLKASLVCSGSSHVFILQTLSQVKLPVGVSRICTGEKYFNESFLVCICGKFSIRFQWNLLIIFLLLYSKGFNNLKNIFKERKLKWVPMNIARTVSRSLELKLEKKKKKNTSTAPTLLPSNQDFNWIPYPPQLRLTDLLSVELNV